MQNCIHIVKQHEALAKYEHAHTRIHPDTSEMLLYKLQELFEVEKIYRRKGLTNQDVCEKLGTNRTYLTKIINDNYRKGFVEYLNGYRVQEAKELLKAQNEGGEYANYTIQAISEMVGFVSISAFYGAFKLIVGVTPAEYKRVVSKSSIE